MKVDNCSSIVEAALSDLRSGFEVHAEDGGCRIVAPFMRKDGDRFELLVDAQEDELIVTDGGETLDFLQLSGINTRRNRAFDTLLNEVQRAHQVSVERGAVTIRASGTDSVGKAVVGVLAAMSDLSQFELTRRQALPRTFDALVEGELVGQGVPYEARVVRHGEIRDRTFRFGIDGSRNTVVEPLGARASTRAVELASVLIVSVEDVWRRDPSLAAIAVLDDHVDVWSERAAPDLRGSGLNVVLWSRRHDELAATMESPRRSPRR